MTAYDNWTNAVSRLTATQQRTILDTLDLAANEDIKIVFGINVMDGRPCLINAIGSMVKEINEAPIDSFNEIVGSFDYVCHAITGEQFGYVTVECARTLIAIFPALKPLPQPELEELPALPEGVVIPDYFDANA